MSCEDASKSIGEFKRGDTFALHCTYKLDSIPASVDLIDIKCQIREKNGNLIAVLDVHKLDQKTNAGEFSLTAKETEIWPITTALCDIEYSDGEFVNSSETFFIEILRDITIE